MSRIRTVKLHDELTKKKENYDVRVTTFLHGTNKDHFLNDCIRREFNESKMAQFIIDTYYSIISNQPVLMGKEPNEIKKFIIDRIKL